MKKGLIKFYVFLLFCIISTLCVSTITFADTQKQWITLPTSVSQDGSIISTKIYGYYTNIDNFGQVFVVCDPNTGQETGDAYIPNVKIGDKQTQEIVGYNEKKVLDFNNMKRIDSIQVSVIMPNLPTGSGYDLDTYNKTGVLNLISTGCVSFPGDYSWEYKVISGVSDGYLVVAQITNPNPFPVVTSVSAGFGSDKGIFNLSNNISLGPNETKYVLMNKNPFDMLGFSQWSGGQGSAQKIYNMSKLEYSTKIVTNNDSEYPNDILNGVYFSPFGISPTSPLKYMYYFDGWSGSWNTGFNYFTGYAIYDFDTKQWTITPQYQDVQSAFQQFGLKVPFISLDNSLVGSGTHFRSLFPITSVPDLSKSSDDIYRNYAGGWVNCSPPQSSGEVYGPKIAGTSWEDDNLVWYCSPWGDINLYPKGTCITNNGDARYYDTDWMNLLPVIKARPIFIDNYSFISTNGNIGYIQKNNPIPGYLLTSDFIERPTININTHVSNIHVTRDTRYYYITVEYDQTITARNPNNLAVKWDNLGGSLCYYDSKVAHYIDDNIINCEPYGTPNEEVQLQYYENYYPHDYWYLHEILSRYGRYGKHDAINYIMSQIDRHLFQNISYNRYIAIGNTIELGPNETKTISSKTNTMTMRIDSQNPYVWGMYPGAWYGGYASHIDSNLYQTILNCVSSMNGVSEAAFNPGTTFSFTPTFQNGIGGILTGTSKYYMGGYWYVYRGDGYYEREKSTRRLVGFYNNTLGLHSWYSAGSYGGGMIVATTAGIPICNTIELFPGVYDDYSYNMQGVNGDPPQWRVFSNGKVYPQDRPGS
ncbi:hypothetical protein [Thermoanaerobacterium thermosaccharolyticum]|uniref:hypothetical protein n=1 Tax=Thermoanaerobacterium thermosaccharolyticum TaxID=1517 RepID=UPI002FDA0660